MPSETKTIPYNPELRNWLIEYANHPGLTRGAIGSKLGYGDGSTVSRYINGNPQGDIDKFEARLKDLKRSVETLRESAPDGTILETSVLLQTYSFCDLVKSSLDVGVLHGKAGVGKTTALRAYAQEHLTAVYMETNAAQANGKGMRCLFWDSLSDTKGHTHHVSRWNYIIQKYKGSDRLIIIDNAQRLDREGRDFVFDFHDATGCPVVLNGNPCILTNIAKNDQQHSRCLLQHEVELKAKEIPDVAKVLVDIHLPGCPEVYPYATQVAEREGYLRALKKVLKTTAAFRELKGLKNPVTAFKSAHAKSTRNYKLID